MNLPGGAVRVDAPPDGLAMLAGTDLLQHASSDDVAAIATSAEWLSLEAGTELFAATRILPKLNTTNVLW